MNWREEYQNKCMDALQALQVVRSGDRVWIQSGCGTPSPLVDALVARASELRNVEIVHMKTLGNADYTKPEYEGIFRHRGLFLGDNVREAVIAGRADYTPIFLSEIEGLFLSGALPLDVVLMQVSPPDDHGYVTLGTTVDCTLNATRCARTVIAEVNERMPRTHGETAIHVSRISAIVETSRPLLESQSEPFTAMHRRMAENVASLIPDGATLQTGIGGIPEAVLACLGDKHDLGIHSEMVGDGVIDLMESGVLNGERKSLHRGKAVIAFVLGSQRLIDYIHDNPAFEFRSDLLHQRSVCGGAERQDGGHQLGAAGGPDGAGVRGLAGDQAIQRIWRTSGFHSRSRALQGRSADYCAAFDGAKSGTVSRIVPVLEPGAGVVTSRADVHYVVTEHGIAYLHGKTLRERAEALIAIADPRFRGELEDFAVRSHYMERKAEAVLA